MLLEALFLVAPEILFRNYHVIYCVISAPPAYTAEPQPQPQRLLPFYSCTSLPQKLNLILNPLLFMDLLLLQLIFDRRLPFRAPIIRRIISIHPRMLPFLSSRKQSKKQVS
jgi:hypothetical protein